jgi:hypothetical protein
VEHTFYICSIGSISLSGRTKDEEEEDQGTESEPREPEDERRERKEQRKPTNRTQQGNETQSQNTPGGTNWGRKSRGKTSKRREDERTKKIQEKHRRPDTEETRIIHREHWTQDHKQKHRRKNRDNTEKTSKNRRPQENETHAEQGTDRKKPIRQKQEQR